MTKEKPCVLIGVTGCIAAYKSCEILRGLQKAGVRCKVVMTEHATRFVDPVTFRALTHEPVAVGLFDDPSDPIHHISLAQECDVFLIAPCTANVAAKIAHGIADDLLSTTALATRAPLLLAPAMNVGMYEAAATQANFEILRARGVRFVEAESGYQACGDVGRGRLADPEVVVARTLALLAEVLEGAEDASGEDAAVAAADGQAAVARMDPSIGETAAADLRGRHVMITAGPTVEPIDAVRYISNRSSGKMGYALAEAALARGARVSLVSGPVALAAPDGAALFPVKTARDMLAAATKAFADADIAVFSAAVADFRPADPSDRKLKKGADDEALESIRLVENPDILKTLGHAKRAGQVVVGFAAETDDVIANAQAKLVKKNADMIVANQVGEGRAFGTDDNQASLVTADGVLDLPAMSKRELAERILDAAAARL